MKLQNNMDRAKTFSFFIPEASHQVMHYQTMQGEFLSSPLNIRDANYSANKKSYVLGHLAASLFLL